MTEISVTQLTVFFFYTFFFLSFWFARDHFLFLWIIIWNMCARIGFLSLLNRRDLLNIHRFFFVFSDVFLVGVLLLLPMLSLSLTIVIKNAGKRIRACVYAKRIQLSLLYAISYDIIFIRIRSSFDSSFFFIGIKTRKTIRKNRNGGEPTKADHTLTHTHMHICIFT